MQNFIAYYRVSTKKQDIGLEAQKAICEVFAASNDARIIAEYSEKESGKATKDLSIEQYLSHHTQLPIALKQCKDLGATLVVAKVDRLVRDYAIGGLLVRAYSIEFCDHPHMTSLEQGIFFSMAMQEREYISQRTREALQKIKSKGVKLGAPNATWTDEQREQSAKVRRNKALNNADNLRAYTLVHNTKGLSLNALAILLNEGGFTTAKGGKWTAMQVKRLIQTFERDREKER